MEAVQISYIQPFAIDKNIGAEYNKRVEDQQTEWICITDQDACFLHSFSKIQIEEIVRKAEFELYGCMTNRVGLPYLCVPGMFDEPDIRKHIKVAEELHETKYGIVEPTAYPIAGFFMLFKKETWLRCGKFKEKCIDFDRQFSAKVKSKGIIQGVYMFHLYRFNSNNPKYDCKHLI